MNGNAIPYTFEERVIIESLVKLDYSLLKIAKEINKSQTGISYEIRRAGGRKGYTAVEAHKIALEKLKTRGHHVIVSHQNRIKNVLECIKEMSSEIESIKDTLKIVCDHIFGEKNG